MLHTGGLDDVVVNKLKLDVPPADLTEWKQVVSRIATRSKTCSIALVGKYVKLHDAYLSVMESLYHSGFTLQKVLILRRMSPPTLPSARRMMMSGFTPMPCSSFTECCAGLDLYSSEPEM